MSNFNFQIYGDDTSLQNISSTLTSPGSFDHNLDMPLFDYYPNEIAITHSIESSRVLDLLQSSFYVPIYAWLEESYFKIFSCHLLLPFVNISSNLILSIFQYEAFLFILLIFDMFYFAGLQMLQWLHWLFHFT